MTTTDATSSRRSTRSLLGLTSALLALQVLNLAVFDDLRTDPLVGAVETFTKPQHLSSILAVLLAVVLVALRHRAAARVAVVVAWVEIATFTFFHGIPVEIGPSKPYWGDGTGDALQWVGFLAILACSAAIVFVGRQRSPTWQRRMPRPPGCRRRHDVLGDPRHRNPRHSRSREDSARSGFVAATRRGTGSGSPS